MNSFLNSHRVLHVERQLVHDGRDSAWAVCISYQDGAVGAAKEKRAKIDYRDVLSEPEFAVYARMRALRKQLSERDGVPAYTVLTNDQMAAIVQNRAITQEAMRGIDGIGEGKIEKYGEAFQKLLQDTALPAGARAKA